MASVKKIGEVYDILESYSGINPLILTIKDKIKNYKELSDFEIDYVLRNNKISPRQINKVVRLVDWFSQSKMSEWNTDFLPEKLKIVSYLGDTEGSFHVYAQYRMSVPPQQMFIPKKAVIGNFLLEDYHNIQVDFDRYNTLMHRIDSTRNLKEHQKEGIKFLLSRKKCILADDMGLGKTTQLSVAAVEGNFDSILIICPASLKSGWKNELEWFVPERDITIIEGFSDKNKSELEKMLGYSVGKSGLKVEELKKEAEKIGKWKDNRFVIVNYDILSDFFVFPNSRSQKDKEEAFKNSPMLQFIANKKSLIIIDEAHRLSKNDSQQYKIVKKLIKDGKPNSLYLATGTPITNNPSNLYNLLQLIEGAIPDDYEYFRTRYCGAIKIPAKGEKERWTNYYLQRHRKASWYDLNEFEKSELKDFIRANAKMITIDKDAMNLDELRDRISHIYLRRMKDELNDLPGKTVHEVFYNFNEKQKVEYSKLWEEYETAQLELDPEKELNKDLLDGMLYRKYCSDQMVPNTIRLTEHFINQGEKVIIACCYDNELYTLQEHFGEKCVIYNGKMSSKEKDLAKDSFLNDDSIMVFIANIQSAGVGLTLIKSHILIFNNMSFVPGDNRQMEDRIYRIGQTHDVDIYYQMFTETQYEKMWNIVLKKELTINSVIKSEKEK